MFFFFFFYLLLGRHLVGWLSTSLVSLVSWLKPLEPARRANRLPRPPKVRPRPQRTRPYPLKVRPRLLQDWHRPLTPSRGELVTLSSPNTLFGDILCGPSSCHSFTTLLNLTLFCNQASEISSNLIEEQSKTSWT